MKAMLLRKPAPIETAPLAEMELPTPQPGPGEILVRVEVCGVCRTDLHVVEGELPVHKEQIIPGHEIVGRVEALGEGCSRFRAGERIGGAWLHRACGVCEYCRRGEENLCDSPLFTGYDVDGGYAEFTLASEEFAYPLADSLSAAEIAPLLCAGIIGYRALRRSEIKPGGRLGLFGFGGSAHIVIQIARHWGCEVYVASREKKHQTLAREMGAAWVGDAAEMPPNKLNSAILFAPAGKLVLPALEALDKGGTLALAGIYLTQIPPLDYDRHLFRERTVRSVTANTREDGKELLRLAAEIPLVTHTQTFALAEANEALRRLKHDEIRGAAVLTISPEAH
ncbi:MAG: zinc-binding alcohol dehydrogenase family protein [Armatimonadetes bacterium]|nr:zinc-binding alcohol dehydrogenase family protein [Armatimonadota bacterium]NIM24044.1 zinc-binding alcohol dehydrogenase family protein [Armatimonadota bacterium]NIM67898.1 zinc-binding alcohol dehydrogenase family protein [Armatimonadota bacterium]NIM76420.1 zinc-binding alcohol dehydrogenase family protein [Armatimonadota bacterium]NIN06128.1 zinc-binding alcohol dehydrogenase family protein [Armatimonadota bacterium]